MIDDAFISGFSSSSDYLNYLKVLSRQTEVLALKMESKFAMEVDGEDLDDDDDESPSIGVHHLTSDPCLQSCLAMINEFKFIDALVSTIESCEDESIVRAMCQLCHNLLLANKHAMYNFNLLNTLPFKPVILRRLWAVVLSTKQTDAVAKPMALISVIAKGMRMSRHEQDQIVPALAVFASLMRYLLVTVHDTEFFGDGATGGANVGTTTTPFMPFGLSEFVSMSLMLRDAALGLVELAYPESRPSMPEDYQSVLKTSATANKALDTKIWSHVFAKIVALLQQLHSRDMRRQFCPDGHWICSTITLPLDQHQSGLYQRRSRLRHYQPFQGLRVFSREELDAEGPPLTTKEVRLATILREMPFVIDFSQRVLVFSSLVTKDKMEYQGDASVFMDGAKIDIQIRRNYLYEDAFDKLSVENGSQIQTIVLILSMLTCLTSLPEPNLRLKMRVQLKNATGLDEAGIDGGGLFREFLTELLKTAFDPNRGFFKLTHDNQLYPNPSVRFIEENFIPHYFFIGRMVGKVGNT